MKHGKPKFGVPPRSTFAKPAKSALSWQAWHEQARALLRDGRPADAIPLLQRAVDAAPTQHDPRRDLASTFYKLGRLGDALREFNEVAVRFPERSDAANNVAGVLSSMGHQTLAFQAVERALALDGTNVAAMHNLAEILKHMGDWAGARDIYTAALALSPNDGKARMQCGMIRVALGDWRTGWAEMEAREQALGRSVLFTEQPASPRWTGEESLEGKHLLVQHEQGLGDSIMCVRFARDLAARGATVHWRCPAPLVEFLSGAEGVTSCTAVGTAFPEHDLHVPLMSLMATLGVEIGSLRGAPYLTPAGECPAHVAELLPRDGVPTVALTWSGNPMHTNDHRRSIKGELLAPLLRTEGVRFVAMQKAPSVTEVLPAELQPLVQDTGAHCRTFTESAHALRRVDLVVSVDTAVAHLAGAIGAPTVLLLPFTPDYRWGTTGTASPWYDTMTVVRQAEAMQWGEALEAVRRRALGLR